MASRSSKLKESRGRRYKNPVITFTKDTGMPVKAPEGPSPPSKQERDDSRAAATRYVKPAPKVVVKKTYVPVKETHEGAYSHG